MSASATQLPGVAPPTPLPCERCGFAPPTARVAVGGKRVCLACAEHLTRASLPAPALWPTLVVFATGFLSPLAPPVLAAVNWARLGERRRMREALGLALVGGICDVGRVVAMLQGTAPERQLPFIAVGLLIAFFATIPLRPRYLAHRERGGKNAGFLPALLIAVGLSFAVSGGVTAAMLASGKVDLAQLIKASGVDPSLFPSSAQAPKTASPQSPPPHTSST
jgi:hypothetical protein